MSSPEIVYQQFSLASRIEGSGVVVSPPCQHCVSLQRACVISFLSNNCSTCVIVGRDCPNRAIRRWDDYLAVLRDVQAREAFARLELSTVVNHMNRCLDTLNDIIAEKSLLIRDQLRSPITRPGVSELDASNS